MEDKVKNKFAVLCRYGSGHYFYCGEVEEVSAKNAFSLAVNEFFEFDKYEMCTGFYVQSYDEKLEEYEKGYGYDIFGQRDFQSFRTSVKWIIINLLK